MLVVVSGSTYTEDLQYLVIFIKYLYRDCEKIGAAEANTLAAAISFGDTFVSGLAVETYFAVKLQLVGCKRNITNT